MSFIRDLNLLLLALATFTTVDATSVKMDFLPLGDVRTDPIINPTCLSDHVHTFYGANKLRPETTYADLRSADGNSGNVVENKSLYWHPTIYRVQNGVYTKADIYFSSAYYIWTTGQATAFPNGFKMVAGFNGDPLARANFECVGCANSDVEDGCQYKFFPTEPCAELEVSMAFPSCWDGVNIDSEDHQSHVSYDIDGGSFDGECPSTHPVKIPEIQLFFRILPYPGGTHVFADGTNYYHADYFSGWDQGELQNVLDNCENPSEAANPDAWCEDFLTFRDAPKNLGEDENIVQKLLSFQPEPFDFSTITDEVIDNVSELPRGACTGELKPEGPTGPTPTAPTPTAPTPTAPTPTAPTPTAPTPTPPSNEECQDSPLKFRIKLNSGRTVTKNCGWVKKRAWRCNLDGADTQCPSSCNTCDICIDSELRSKFRFSNKNRTQGCSWIGIDPDTRCKIAGMFHTCRETCGQCQRRL